MSEDTVTISAQDYAALYALVELGRDEFRMCFCQWTDDELCTHCQLLDRLPKPESD